MIDAETVIALVKEKIPDAVVSVADTTGTKDHLMVHVISSAFKGMGLMDRHRMVQKSLNAAMADGRIHALEIKTEELTS